MSASATLAATVQPIQRAGRAGIAGAWNVAGSTCHPRTRALTASSSSTVVAQRAHDATCAWIAAASVPATSPSFQAMSASWSGCPWVCIVVSPFADGYRPAVPFAASSHGRSSRRSAPRARKSRERTVLIGRSSRAAISS